MPRTVDIDTVLRPLAQDAPPDVIRRQQLDTAQLVGQVVATMRGSMQARLESDTNEPRIAKPRFDAGELERELLALNTRLAECRANLALTPRNQDGKLRFLRLGEKRAAALMEALERLQPPR